MPLHGAVLHGRVSTRSPHARPPDAGVSTVRVRVCVPELHGLVHAENAPQDDTTQFIGHSFALQLRVSSR